jgi:hypothetical protein
MFDRHNVATKSRKQQKEALSDRRVFANVNESGPVLTNKNVMGSGGNAY